VLFVLLKLIICAARTNFPEVENSRIRILLPPRRQDAKRQAQGLSSRANARDLGKISLFVRNDNALPLRLCDRYSETDRCAKRTLRKPSCPSCLRGESDFSHFGCGVAALGSLRLSSPVPSVWLRRALGTNRNTSEERHERENHSEGKSH